MVGRKRNRAPDPAEQSSGQIDALPAGAFITPDSGRGWGHVSDLPQRIAPIEEQGEPTGYERRAIALGLTNVTDPPPWETRG